MVSVGVNDATLTRDDPAVESGAKIAPFGREDTAHELTSHAEQTQDTLVDAVENAEVAEIKRAVFRALTRLRAATIKEFDTIARRRRPSTLTTTPTTTAPRTRLATCTR